MSIGTRIADCRKRCGMSQELLAQKMQVSRQAVTKWESGKSVPNSANLQKLAALFEVDAKWLLEEPPQNAALSAVENERPNRQKREILQRIYPALGLLLAWIVVYILGRIAYGDHENSSLLGWLLGKDSSSYLYGWLLTSGMFCCAMAASVLGSVLGRRRFAWSVFAGSFLGFVLGEWLGPNPAGAALGHGDYGWAIWLGMLLISAMYGIALERLKRRGIAIGSRAGYIVTLCAAALAALMLLLVRSSMSPAL